MILIRILSDLLILFAIFLLPFWFVILALFFLAFYFKLYIEFVVTGLITDLIYAPESLFMGAYYITIAVLLFFIVIEFLKRKVLLNLNN